MGVPLYKAAVLMGYQKAGVAGPRGQLISVSIGSPVYPGQWYELKIGEGAGIYMHGRTKRPMCWWVSEQWLADRDLVRITTKVGIAGVGRDDERSMELIFSVDPTAPLVEVKWKGLGYRDWPLLKGHVREVSRTTPQMERDISITAVYDEGHATPAEGEGADATIGQHQSDK